MLLSTILCNHHRPTQWANDDDDEHVIALAHAPLSYFALDQLQSKGPRKNADVGQPHDATRPLVQVDTTTSGSSPTTSSSTSISAGSWWCAQGGWPSPALRDTTEVFYVFCGHGCVTDSDGTTKHYFSPGDTVILPKGWSGRWDVLQDIHKVWFVHDHPKVEETSHPIRAVVTPYCSLVPMHLQRPQGGGGGGAAATDGSSPSIATRTIYDVGPTNVDCWTCTPGSFPVQSQRYTHGVLSRAGRRLLSHQCCARRTAARGVACRVTRWWFPEVGRGIGTFWKR